MKTQSIRSYIALLTSFTAVALTFPHSAVAQWAVKQTITETATKSETDNSIAVDGDLSGGNNEFTCPAGEAPALVYTQGIEYTPALTSVCLNHLGVFNPTTGALISSNLDANGRYVLKGKYLETGLQTLTPTLSRYTSPNNDFRIDPVTPLARQGALYGAEVHLYYYITNFRDLYLNDTFINSLSLPAAAQTNLKFRQFNPTLSGGGQTSPFKAIVTEGTTFSSALSSITTNSLTIPSKQRATTTELLNSMAFDPEYVVGQYAGLAANWISAGTAPWPTDPNFGNIGNLGWRTDVRPAILEGFKLWNAYNYSKKTELYKHAMRVARRWTGSVCGTETTADCNKGWAIDNAMMYSATADAQVNASTTSHDGLLFPLYIRSGVPADHNGPRNAELAGMFVGALFYDLSKEAGLGDSKTNQIFWKTMSLIDPGQPLSMPNFAIKVQQAARLLFPSGNPSLSWYEQDIVDVFASRGVVVNGAANFINNIPAQIGIAGNLGPSSTPMSGTVGLGSSIPETAGNTTSGYNHLTHFKNSYTVSSSNTQYVTYQFYKYSKYGPCDSLDLTNGTISEVNTSNPTLNYDSAMSLRYTGRSIGNMLLSAPGTTLQFIRKRQTCSDEREGYYAEDVRPVGFRVLKAIPNGFSFVATKTYASPHPGGSNQYKLKIVDPSLTMTGANTGPATYNWRFTSYNGGVVNATGQEVILTTLSEQPFTLYVERIRGGNNDNMTFRERGSDLDRSNGKNFNQNYVDPGYRVGFDAIVNNRVVRGGGSYNSSMDTAGNTFGVQARRWTTPNRFVQPRRFSTVSHGVGTIPGSTFNFQNAAYFNACIWGSRSSVTDNPGCRNNSAADDFETQVPFSQVGINLALPFARVTGLNYEGHLWTVNYPTNWLLQPNKEYHFGSHIAANVASNGYSYHVCSAIYAPGVAGASSDRSDWLAGANWNGSNGAPISQTMRSFLSNQSATPNCTFAAYRFEGQTIGQPLTITSLVSRKVHASRGAFDLPINLSGSSTIEPRAGGSRTLIFTFSSPISALDGAISSNEFVITNGLFGSASISGNVLTLTIPYPTDRRYLNVQLKNIVDSVGAHITGVNSVTIGNLYGDVVPNGVIDSADLAAVQATLNTSINASSYRNDIDANGIHSVLDQQIINSRLGVRLQ